MKQKLLVAALLSLITCQTNTLLAQNSGKILKVSYVTTPQSPKILLLLKKQIPNPEQYNKIAALLSEYKFYHTLYVDTKTQASVFSLDSIHSVPNVSTIGNVVFAVKDDKNNYTCREKFGASEFLFKGNTAELDWDVTKETAVVNGFKCLKAMLKNSPDVAAWFAPDIPIGNGPGIYYGLPGLVIKVQTNYDETITAKVSYTADAKNFQSAYDEKSEAASKGKVLALKEVTTSKIAFMRMVESKVNE
ncbi:GLPGLI family protein [Chitinophaga pendula]|uniref:GLPGLI family protein n=1 Tax=Chitinophaga TaxID=79328 RepID=UPI000BB096B4|nr:MULTISPECIES: GLPGLI family protein [Chitinophaga]ASZ12981.1 hypothetical protein CK934_19460 [Chitinophaga sp. MD30]UCJ09387.1 GLPGLI family protein [Chitinophaga pendula]